jgi:hypothetical protein
MEFPKRKMKWNRAFKMKNNSKSCEMWLLKNLKRHVKWDSQNHRNNVMGLTKKNLKYWSEMNLKQDKEKCYLFHLYIKSDIIYIKATVSVYLSVCLCGQCLEDSSSHCLFPVELPQM